MARKKKDSNPKGTNPKGTNPKDQKAGKPTKVPKPPSISGDFGNFDDGHDDERP